MQRIAIVGFGAMGQMHARCYQQLPAAQVVALVNTKRRDAGMVQKTLGLDVPVFPQLADLLADAGMEVDIVDICLPTDLHAAACHEAIRAGKHVFCEKPLAMDPRQAAGVVRAAEKQGVHFMVGHCIRFWPEYQVLERYVRSKPAGKLLSLTLQRRSSRPLYSSGNWLQDPARSLSAAYDLHIHDTDFVLHLLGLPRAVTSVGTMDKSGWAHIHTIYHYDTKAPSVTAEGGWNYPSKWGFKMSFQAVFERGTLEFDFGSQPALRFTGPDAESVPVETDKAALETSGAVTGNIADLGGYFNELKYFIDCAERRRAPKIATAAQAAQTVRVAHAEMKSAETGRTVKVRA